MTRLAAALIAVLVLAAPAVASEEQPTLAELENEIYCPTCKSILALSNAPVAERIRGFVRERIAAGDTKSEIKDALVAQFGESVLAAPPKEGFNLLAWVLPFVGLGVAAIVVGVLVYRWTRAGDSREGSPPVGAEQNGRRPLDPELERRLDEELARFDS
jgi:cytochrome c-type biogenesis protein CcmH